MLASVEETCTVTTINEIQSAIESLPREEYARLVGWIRERDWEAWDKQLAQDASSGKLDFLVDEATAEKKQGKLRPL